jgi:AraC-like DNA-binding protein/tetratricopeptide (TPR) repeat protein
MNPKESTQRRLQEFADDRAAYCHSEESANDRRISKARRCLGLVISGDGGLRVDTLLETLEALDTDPADFFARVFGTRLSPERLLLRLERQVAAEGPSALDALEVEIENGCIEVSIQSSGSAPVIEDLSERLRGFNEELYSFPDRALASARELVLSAAHRAAAEVSPENLDLLCRALGCLGSAYRALVRFGCAARCLRTAFQLSDAGSLDAARSELLLRLSHLIGDQGDYEVGVEIAREACDTALLLEDTETIGKALAVRAVMLNKLGQWVPAVKAYELALTYLPKRDWISTASCHQGLGLIYTKLGQLENARDSAEKGARLHKTRKGPNWWRMVWLQGEIALKSQDRRSAVQALGQVRDGFLELGNPLNLALVSLRLVKAISMADQGKQVNEPASEMILLLNPLAKHRIARAVACELVRALLRTRDGHQAHRRTKARESLAVQDPWQSLANHAAATTLQRVRQDAAGVSEPVRSVLTYLDEHFFEIGFHVAHWERHGGLTHQVRRLFRSELGVAPKAYLLRLKREVAEWLLRETDAPIWRIAAILGYSRPRNFSRDFGRWTGLAAREYRRRNQVASPRSVVVTAPAMRWKIALQAATPAEAQGLIAELEKRLPAATVPETSLSLSS